MRRGASKLRAGTKRFEPAARSLNFRPGHPSAVVRTVRQSPHLNIALALPSARVPGAAVIFLIMSILLMGLRKSGKSSIRQVVFHNMPPLETLYLESTNRQVTEHIDSLLKAELIEIPGKLHGFDAPFDPQAFFANVNSIVYVIDSQDEYLLALQNIVQVIAQAYKVNPHIHFEALIHKIDGSNDDYRLDTQRDVIQRINDELSDIGIDDADLTFHMTSIFDNSIIESFSRILQKLVPELNSLTQMLDTFCLRTGIDKAFFFDAATKIYFATDSSPVDVETHQVCSDFVDVAIDLATLYKCGSADVLSPTALCTSRLQNGIIIYLAQMLKGLLLVGLSRAEAAQRMALVEYNFNILRNGLEEIYSVEA